VPEDGAELTASYSERVGPPPDPPTEPPIDQPGVELSPTPPAPPAEPQTERDTAGPWLRLLGVNAARGRIRGAVTDPSGVSAVQVALRARLRKDECSWWLAGKRTMSVSARRCDRPRWMDARLASTSGDVEWLLDLGKRLPRGSYRVLVRARDTAGNVSDLPLRRASLVKVGPRRP